MPQLLLEILSEEIPARMQVKAQADLVKALMDGLTTAALIPEGIKGFSGPRRLVAVIEGLPVKSADILEDIQGPKEGAPQPAIEGFLRKAGLKSISEARLQEVPKKGRIFLAQVRKPGRETAKLIAELAPAIIRSFHWPKSMRWGSGDLRWVRPISRILCTFDGEVVPFEVEGIKSDNLTEGHRVMGRGPFKVRRFEDYEDALKNRGRVILDRDERKEIILTEAKQLCAAQNLELVEDIGLLEEVAGLAEWPVIIIGDMDKSFLDLPPEVIRLSMRTHQKYFAVRDPAKNGLAPKFIVVANLDAADGGEKIAEGNSRVLSARLNDARFFWDNDRKVKLESRSKKLGDIVFHEKLGSVRDKVYRVERLAEQIAERLFPKQSVIARSAQRAVRLAKCDLVSDMVGEFPELEGVMGRYYAMLEKEPAAIADAIRDHYKPKGPSDEVPVEPIAVIVALADKFDTLAGFWEIGEKPTGSKDPFALRRAALGAIRILLGSTTGGRTDVTPLRLKLTEVFWRAFSEVVQDVRETPNSQTLREEVWKTQDRHETFERNRVPDLNRHPKRQQELKQKLAPLLEVLEDDIKPPAAIADLLSFFADRLKVHLREHGARHDLIDAVFALGEDDLVLIVKRVEALGEFLDTEDGKNLLASYKRSANILAIEEKNDSKSYSGEGKAMPGDPPEVDALLSALKKSVPEAEVALGKEDFAAAMKAMSRLRGPVDAFFDKVTVNADQAVVRENRLKLLSQIRDALNRVADFSRIEG